MERQPTPHPSSDGEVVLSGEDETVPETGYLHEEALRHLDEYRRVEAHSATTSSSAPVAPAGFAYPPAQRNQIRESWDTLMRWSKVFRTRQSAESLLEETNKVVVFGGGSFGTAMGVQLARQKPGLEVVLLLRDPYLSRDINTLHENTRYLSGFKLPHNVRATTSPTEAILGAQFAVHAVPVQSSRAFLQSIKDILPPTVPIVCVSKGLEVGNAATMSDLIPSALERKQPAVFLSGPSFAKEVMENRPTGVVAACKDPELARTVQALFASPTMRVNTTTDVVGVEICGALKNVLAIAAGIVQGLDLGHNALAALVAQGCSEIRWLAEKMGGKSTTMSGLSGLGDIMLTCYGDLSRNRTVGMRLGRGEKIADILASSKQGVAEGVATAGVVVGLARKYRVSLPVLTAVAQVLDNNLTPSEAVAEIMNLPQIEEV
ncbi:hypothetical protein HYH03_001260 [Edaphochlamys debaryana]|uniref:Glycerol-3-phosphate dehydrogenase [NAD(+)] n=1 Tax=Edaphochlamys debaryana TaxID=47281 RepID=A0A835YEM5_9CHLO|nr:hypothetical protein HYH03_001260 [Edaphochlamys debaryana]|eukprot:KAG2501482.1 hypothetical protein HYH03_001260 [Edaphochlamys debaryana]